MADQTPKKVKVEAIKYHTNAGKEYQIGDTYEVDESAVDSLGTNGMALRVDRAAVAKQAAKAAEKPAKAAKPAKARRTAGKHKK
jgi:hypothetical protein